MARRSCEMWVASRTRWLVLPLAALAVLSSARGRNLMAGQRQQNDGTICHGEFYLSAQPNKAAHMWTTCDVIRPEQFITHVAVLDRLCPERGSYAQISKGGICQKSVTVNMWSPKATPLNYSLYIYATPYCPQAN